MIGLLQGKVVDVVLEKGHIIVDISGVGYVVYVTAGTLMSLSTGKAVTLYTHMVVRETALDLYGFTTTNEKRLFELLLTVSGVGPKSALSILSIADESTIYNAISKNETSYLTKVSGIGKKLAGKIVLELKDKIGNVIISDGGQTSDDSSVMEALEAMGYKTAEAREAVKALPDSAQGLKARVAAALKALSK